MWNDIGYTEGCLEVPKKGASVPQPTYTVSDLNISVSEMFTRMKLKAPYTSLMNISYLEMTIDMNNGDDLIIYGWVDSVSLSSDTDGYPITTIDWHIDYWRTYLHSAVFGSGMVRRRPLLSNDDVPPQPYPYRYIEYQSAVITDFPEIWWVVLSVVTSGETSENQWCAFPVLWRKPSTRLQLRISGEPVVSAPSLDDVANGKLDELLGLDPESITYGFITPIPPANTTGSGTADSPVVMIGWGSKTKDASCFVSQGADVFNGVTRSVGVDPIKTDDETIYMVCGPQGESYGTLPWGIEVNGIEWRLVADSTSAYIAMRFYKNAIDANKCQTEGTTFNIPCSSIPVTSNAWSSYVYSGARQAEIDLRKLQADSQAVSGGISTGVSAVSGALSGAMMGAMAGAVGGPVGMLAGAAIGAGASALTGALTTGATYAYQTGEYADRMQSISDYQASHQVNSILLNGGSFDSLFNGSGGVSLVKLKKDDYSLRQRQKDISLYGVNVSEPITSCQSLIDVGGPLQITNLTVRGAIPVEAKQFFRNRFAKGVRMI
jgi:hypothetical protein